MTDEFYRRLNAYKDAAIAYGRNPGPRQMNWLTQSELNVISYVNELQNKIDVMLDLYPTDLLKDEE